MLQVQRQSVGRLWNAQSGAEEKIWEQWEEHKSSCTSEEMSLDMSIKIVEVETHERRRTLNNSQNVAYPNSGKYQYFFSCHCTSPGFFLLSPGGKTWTFLKSTQMTQLRTSQAAGPVQPQGLLFHKHLLLSKTGSSIVPASSET